MQPIYYNIPFVCIFLCMVGGITMPLQKNGQTALRTTVAVCLAVALLCGGLAGILYAREESFVYQMGHFPAPWGNELYVGPLEAMLTAVFALVMAMSILGGRQTFMEDVLPPKQRFYFTMMCMILASLLALSFTNDIFTGYVFIEISTLAACAIVMARDTEKTIAATIRYLVISLLGSGLFLIGLALLYCVTGHLLMPQLLTRVQLLSLAGGYHVPLTVVCGLLAIGMGIKSAMFPFYAWLPQAHGGATTSSSAVLSGLVLKGYIIFLIRIFYRVFSISVVRSLSIMDILFVFGIAGMLLGSVMAMREEHIKRMLAYSSIAQIGYIFMGIGLGTDAGIVAAFFQILSHAVTKPLLFLSAGRLSEIRHHEKSLYRLRGTARSDRLAGVGFTLGGLSMIGIPLLTGFTAKFFFAEAAVVGGLRMWAAILALAVSSVLNALYYIPAIIAIWSRPAEEYEELRTPNRGFAVAAVVLMAGVVLLGTAAGPVLRVIRMGLSML